MKDPMQASGLDSVRPFRDNLIAATALTPESYNWLKYKRGFHGRQQQKSDVWF
jgi:hypothetical protein